MILFDDILEAFHRAEAAFSLPENAYSSDLKRLHFLQCVNSWGYFVLLFTQLERHIDLEFEEVRGDPGEFPFMSRANELYGNNEAVMEWIRDNYTMRCYLAHGRLVRTQIIDVNAFALEMRQMLG